MGVSTSYGQKHRIKVCIDRVAAHFLATLAMLHMAQHDMRQNGSIHMVKNAVRENLARETTSLVRLARGKNAAARAAIWLRQLGDGWLVGWWPGATPGAWMWGLSDPCTPDQCLDRPC